MNEISSFLLGFRSQHRPPPAQVLLAVLGEDHRRIRVHCRTLRSLGDFIVRAPFNRDAQIAGHLLLRFFDVQVPLHCLDEEELLFPVLAEGLPEPDATCLRQLARHSRRHHQRQGRLWAALRRPLLAIAGGHRTVLDRAQLARFSLGWLDQIGLEDTELLPMAERVLAPTRLEELGRQMRDRRR